MDPLPIPNATRVPAGNVPAASDIPKPAAVEPKTEPVSAPLELAETRPVDPVEAALADLDAGQFGKTAPLEAAPPEPVTEAKPPVVDPVEAAVKGESTPPPAEAATVDPAKAAAAEPKPAEPAAAPVEKPRSFALDEKIAIAANPDGTPIEWTRGQLLTALRERTEAQPLAAEAKTFKDIFRMDAATALTEWKPLLDRLAQEPHTFEYISQVLDGPVSIEKARYLAQSAEHYDRETAGMEPRVAQPVKPVQDPELIARLTAAEKQLAETRATNDRARINNEWSEVSRQYPFLLQDKQAKNALLVLADAMRAQDLANGVPPDRARGLIEAAAANRALYEARIIVDGQANPAPAENPAPTPAVPALLGGGASPSGTRRAADPRPKKYSTLEDAVEAALSTDLTR